MNVEHINPFVISTQNVFAKMLDCEITRGRPFLKKQPEPHHDVNSVIELSGKATGTILLSLDRQVALKAASAMLEEQVSEVDADVIDAIGELVNIIAGGAKARLEQFALSVSLPRVSLGKTPLNVSGGNPADMHSVRLFWGGMTLEVGLIEQPAEMPVA